MKSNQPRYRATIELPSDLRLLIACVQPDAAAAHAGRILAGQPVDRDRLLAACFRHGVYPLAYRTLSALRHPGVPDGVLARLGRATDALAIRALRWMAELVRLQRALNAQGIRVMAWKGPSLALRLYGDAGMRPAVDLDLLVAPSDVAAALRVLTGGGYAAWYSAVHLTPRQLGAVLRDDHHLTLRRADDGLLVELHWKWGSGDGDEPDFEALWERRSSVRPFGRADPAADERLAVPGDLDALMGLVVHGARHGWRELRWLCDAAWMLRQQPDVGETVAVWSAGRSGMPARLGQLGCLLREVMGIEPPPAIAALAGCRPARRLADAALKALAEPANRPPGWLDYWRYQARLGAGWRAVGRHYARPDARLYRRIPLPDRWYPLYYLLNPVYRMAILVRRCIRPNL